MKYKITFDPHEIQLTLSESLALPEGHLGQFGSPRVLVDADQLRQIETQVRQFLNRYVEAIPGA